MSEESTPTRQETVEANIAAVIAQYGPDGFRQLVTAMLKDISISLAMLVDGSPEETTAAETTGD